MRYIAVLGFGREPGDPNRARAHEAGAELAKSGFGVAVGNLTGTFHHALAGARAQGGATLAIVEEKLKDLDHGLCDELIVVPDVTTKHRRLANYCHGAIMIGGGSGTASVAAKFLELAKPVIAVEGTGGIVSGGLHASIMLEETVKEAVRIITVSLSNESVGDD